MIKIQSLVCKTIAYHIHSDGTESEFNTTYYRKDDESGSSYLPIKDASTIESFDVITKEWWLVRELPIRHRENGPAIERSNGTKEWWLNGKRHREDGPAIEYANGRKEWWLNGKRHREDGPAIEYANGKTAYWLNGKSLKKDDLIEIYKIALNNNSISADLDVSSVHDDAGSDSGRRHI